MTKYSKTSRRNRKRGRTQRRRRTQRGGGHWGPAGCPQVMPKGGVGGCRPNVLAARDAELDTTPV